MIRDAIQQVAGGSPLTRAEAAAAMHEIMAGEATPAQVAAFLVALRAKGETVEEVLGFVDSVGVHATHLTAPPGAIDTCGTGGDGAGTFNISTAAAIVARGAGVVVAKHGNRAASSQCGSADVLEALGVVVTLDASEVERCLDEAGIAFMFAPSFHPAWRHAGPVRREIGIRTVFNILGPLVNPAQVRRQAIGVPNRASARLMAEVLCALGHERALVFTSDDGLDELTPHAPTHVFDVDGGSVREYDITPDELGVSGRREDLAGGDAALNAAIVREVFEGRPGPRRDAVVINAAAALVVAGRAATVAEAMPAAAASIDDGSARDALDRWARVSLALSA